MTNPINTGTGPAFIAGMADYRGATGLAQSSLKDFIVSPAHYIAACENPIKPTQAMIFGTAFHAEMLLPDPSLHYAVKDKVDGRSKKGKAYNLKFELENPDKAIIDRVELLNMMAMKESLAFHPLASRLAIGLTHREVAMFGDCEQESGVVRLKGQADGYSATDGYAIDYKTCDDASPAGARKAIWDRRYDIQEVQYRWLLDANGKVCNVFYFIFVEKKPPHAVGVYFISKHSREKTQGVWENAINDFAICQASGNWQAYSDSVVEINL